MMGVVRRGVFEWMCDVILDGLETSGVCGVKCRGTLLSILAPRCGGRCRGHPVCNLKLFDLNEDQTKLRTAFPAVLCNS